MKYWQILLSEQRKKGKKGFAIPYIIGSQKFLPTSYSKQNVEQLIIDIATNTLFTVFLKYCMNTGDLILEISNGAGAIFPNYNGVPQDKFCISSFNNDFGDTVEIVAKNLHTKYQPYVTSHQYSINEGSRDNFSPTEVEEIKKWFSVYK